MNNEAQDVKKLLIPKKSALRYETLFLQMQEWKRVNGLPENDYTQDTLLVYFDEISKRYAPSTLWTHYSAIKKVLKVQKDVSIKGYENLQDLLKINSSGHVPKKSQASLLTFIKNFLIWLI